MYQLARAHVQANVNRRRLCKARAYDTQANTGGKQGWRGEGCIPSSFIPSLASKFPSAGEDWGLEINARYSTNGMLYNYIGARAPVDGWHQEVSEFVIGPTLMGALT